MIHLGKRYGLSGPGLREICIRLGVPVPERGHWAKLAAGHDVKRPPLPPTAPATSTGDQSNGARHPRSRRAAGKARSSRGLLTVPALPATNEREAGSAQPRTERGEPLTSQAFHEVLRPLVDVYIVAAAEALQRKAKHEWEEANPGRSYKGPAPRFYSWSWFCDEGQVLAPTHKKSVLRVSLLTYQRALRLLNAMALDLQNSGYHLSFPERRERLLAKRDGATIEIRINEKLEAGTRFDRINSLTKEKEYRKTLSPTGRLSVGISEMGYGESVISETSTAALEERWPELLAAAEYRHKKSLETVAMWKRNEQEREEAARARAAEQKRREEAQRIEAAEKARRDALLRDAQDWRSAELLRRYVAHVTGQQVVGEQSPESIDVWRTWALGVADSLDRRPSLPPAGSNQTQTNGDLQSSPEARHETSGLD